MIPNTRIRLAALTVVLSLFLGAAAPIAFAATAPADNVPAQGGAQQRAGGKQASAAKKREQQRKQKERERKRKERERKQQEEQEQNDESEVWENVFPWVTAGDFSDNWPTGLGLAAAGLLGASILIFTSLGSPLPSMGGKAEWEAVRLELKALEKRREALLEPRERFARSGVDFPAEQRQEASDLTKTLDGMIKEKEAEKKELFRHLLRWGIPLYVLIAGALAALFANNFMQALLVGFAWTAFVDRLGLNRELNEKKQILDGETDKLVTAAKEGQQAQAKLGESEKQLGEAKQALTAMSTAIANLKGSQ